jgi:hypothetical protein
MAKIPVPTNMVDKAAIHSRRLGPMDLPLRPYETPANIAKSTRAAPHLPKIAMVKPIPSSKGPTGEIPLRNHPDQARIAPTKIIQL